MKVWTCESVARSLGCSPQQVKRFCDLGNMPCYRSSSDGMQSAYSYRIHELALLDYFNCETVEDFKKLQYR